MTDAPMKIPVDYKESSEVLQKYLGIDGSPVAFKFATKKEDIPAGMEELDKTIRHCMMVTLARKEKKAFYATADKHECNGGAWALGLKELTPSLKTGEFYFKLGKFASAPACRRTIEHIPHIATGETFATMYAPLESTPFTPQIVIVVANPRGMLKLAQSTLFTLGGRVHSEFLRHPVDLCRHDRADVYHGTPQLFAWLRRVAEVLRHRGRRDGNGLPRRNAARTYCGNKGRCRCTGFEVTG